MSTTVTKQAERRLWKGTSHLLADLLHEWTDGIPPAEAATELQAAIVHADCLPDGTDLPVPLQTYLDDEVYPALTITFRDGDTTTLDQAATDHNRVITDHDVIGARPGGLPAHASIVASDDTAPATADFTVVDSIGEDKADILADHGHQTWEAVAGTPQSALADHDLIGDATAKDLKAEANARAGVETQLAIQAIDRVTNIPTDDEGRGISHDLDAIAHPPGDPKTPVEHHHYHGWHILEDTNHPNVPDDPGPVKTQTLPNGKTELEELCAQLSKGRNPMLIGPPGTGKNLKITTVFHETNRPLVTIPMDNDTMIQELMGNFTVTEDGVVEFEDAALPRIVKNGGGICLDEPNAAPQSVLRGLYKVLEDDPQLVVKGSNEIIEPHPEFYALATINPADLGAGPLPRSFARRFQKIPNETLPPSEEADLLDERVNQDRTIVSKPQLEDLVRVANNLRQQAREGQQVPYITTGELENVCHAADGADGTPGATGLQGALKMEVQGAHLSSVGGSQMGTILDADGLNDLMADL
jgi:MoxR-like ATPase